MDDIKKIMKRQMLPLLPLRGITVFPHMTVHFDVGRTKSIKAIGEAMHNHQLISIDQHLLLFRLPSSQITIVSCYLH